MTDRILLIILFAVSLSLIGVNEVDAKSGRGTDMLDCTNSSNSIISLSKSYISELEYDGVITVHQNEGKCLFKDNGLRFYYVPWIPVKYDIKLIDSEFDYIIDSIQLVGETENTFNFEYLMYYEIPYCVEVTSTWSDASDRIRVKIHTVRVCY